MARYIDADEVKLDIQRNLMPNVDYDGTVTVENAERYFLNLLDNTLTADVVEVVRCKDCEYFEIDEEDELGECKCGSMAMSYVGVLYPQRNDFCRYGERKCDK